jgi:hypothetical protein
LKPVELKGYLVRLRSPKVAHLWTGEDTACKMASTGGLEPSKYALVAKAPVPLCSMCASTGLALAAVDKRLD